MKRILCLVYSIVEYVYESIVSIIIILHSLLC